MARGKHALRVELTGSVEEIADLMSEIRELIEFIPEHALPQATSTLERIERRLLEAVSIGGSPLSGS